MTELLWCWYEWLFCQIYPEAKRVVTAVKLIRRIHNHIERAAINDEHLAIMFARTGSTELAECWLGYVSASVDAAHIVAAKSEQIARNL